MELNWSNRFPLAAALSEVGKSSIPEQVGGLYLWGFEALDAEIIWYVGKATPTLSIRKRLRQHYFALIGAQYQIPRGFFKGQFESVLDVASAWSCDINKRDVVERLGNWEEMIEVFKAGHRFAQAAFVRFARVETNSEIDLKLVESAAIYELQPYINTRGKGSKAGPDLSHVISNGDSDWREQWLELRQTLSP